MMRSLAILLLGCALGAGGVFAFQNHASTGPYAGQDSRSISSLSASDIRSLRAGEGWGLAKPAEFNGFPGPAHVLEFSADLALSPEQQRLIEASFHKMQAAAILAGEKLIEAETALDQAFRDGVTDADIRLALRDAEHARAQLRAIHLSAHLEITPLLTATQKNQYAGLRGYGGGHKGH